MDELRVEQRHYTRENRMLTRNRKSLVLQERMYFRNLPLSDWIEHVSAQIENPGSVEARIPFMIEGDYEWISSTAFNYE
jgi:hypothetical protein